MRFVGLQLEDEVPDHSVISRFRTEMTKRNAYETIFEQINEQLEAKGLIVKTGALVDASVTESPREPKGKTTYAIADDETKMSVRKLMYRKNSNKSSSLRLHNPV